MHSPKAKLNCPTDFNFPFTPFTIQQQLMEELYKVLENKQIGIFETPTGVGKSLTLMFAALKWLEDHEHLVKTELTQRLEDVQKEILKLAQELQIVPDCIHMHSKISQQRQELLDLKDLNKLLEEFEEKLKEIKNNRKALEQTRSSGNMLNKVEDNVLEVAEDNILLNDSDLAENEENFDLNKKREKYRNVQIFFCYHTHTQLARVVKEINRTNCGERIRCVSVPSLQQLCIHKQLRKINNTALINEKCLDMAKEAAETNTIVTASDTEGCVQKKLRISQNTGSSATTKCEFNTQTLILELCDLSLVDILDIEDLVKEGEQLEVCPYYAARNAVKLAQIVMLPYQLLLHKRTRQQIGIDLKGSIVIIDETHNLLDTISQMYSWELNLQQLRWAHQIILAYKYINYSCFNSFFLLSINQLLFVIQKLRIFLKTLGTSFRMLCTDELMSEADFFNIDIYSLLQFCVNTRFDQKLQGFFKRSNAQPNPNENQASTSGKSASMNLLQPLQKYHTKKFKERSTTKLVKLSANKVIQDKIVYPMRALITFLEALCEKSEDGRILVNFVKNCENQSSYKYILLNPGEHFQDIVKETRAIIIADGNMQPTAELTEQLFNSCPERVKLGFYDHVAPDNAVLPIVLTSGHQGRDLCFNYAERFSFEMVSELCSILEDFCSFVPAGLVCFLPTYDYLDTVYAHLEQSEIIKGICLIKKVFKEPQNISSNDSACRDGESVEELLDDYIKAIKNNPGGALLLCVVGGKLSGLNFADDLCRGVIVVGMLDPNLNAPELLHRMTYLDSTFGLGSGSKYYENLCMKAVNQCIGRSLSHIRDYACVYLLDKRYGLKNIQRKLPQWISKSLKVLPSYYTVKGETIHFLCNKAS